MAGLATDLSAVPNPVIVKTALEDIEWLMENTSNGLWRTLSRSAPRRCSR
jgi:hypothetical protein